MTLWWLMTTSVAVTTSAPAPSVDATAIVDRVDRLLRGDSSEGEMSLSVVTRRWTRTLTMMVWSEGTEKALILPKIDRTIRVHEMRVTVEPLSPSSSRLTTSIVYELPPGILADRWSHAGKIL
jgi:hypothetical protein